MDVGPRSRANDASPFVEIGGEQVIVETGYRSIKDSLNVVLVRETDHGRELQGAQATGAQKEPVKVFIIDCNRCAKIMYSLKDSRLLVLRLEEYSEEIDRILSRV